MILFAAQESSALPTLAETQAVAAEVHDGFTAIKAKFHFRIHQSMGSRAFIRDLPAGYCCPYHLYWLTDRHLHQPFSEKDL